MGQAIINEATALTVILDDADGLPSASGDALRLAMANYASNLINVEWPELARGFVSSFRPDELDRLRILVRASGDADMIGACTSPRSRMTFASTPGSLVFRPPTGRC